MSQALKERLGAVPPLAWALALTIACLVPFLNKAFHVDDTLFLRAAEQIQKHPADFYGFKINWFGTTSPMVEVFDNPPLVCYFIALVAVIAGWTEPVLHSAFLLVALAVTWGVFSLARSHCERPLLATIVAVLTPVFVISGTTVMCDMMLLAFWTWSLVLYERGLARNHLPSFLASGVLVGLAFWTKFIGLALVPLLAVYGLCRQRRAGYWLVALAVPLAFAIVYEWATFRLYGKGLLFAAASYSSNFRKRGEFAEEQILGLEFIGGCFVTMLFYAPCLWTARHLLRGVCLAAACFVLPFVSNGQHRLLWGASGHLNWPIYLQSALFLVAGFHVLVLAASDFWGCRDASSILLLLWVAGILVFATVLNWTMNGRSLLPIVPAVGILAARRLDRRPTDESNTIVGWTIVWPVVFSAALSLCIARADYELANTARAAAIKLCASYQPMRKPLWFQGHWGFQYYMEKLGARAMERENRAPTTGDLVVVPIKSPNIFDFAADRVRWLETVDYAPRSRFSIINYSGGTSFYAALGQPFPFSVGHSGPERYFVFEATQPLSWVANSPDSTIGRGALARQLDIEHAIEAAHGALLRDPQDAKAHLDLGRILILRSRETEARTHFEEALRTQPNNIGAHLELAALFNRQDKPAEATGHYRAALRIDPDTLGALDDLAWLLATSRDATVRNGPEAVILAERAFRIAGSESGGAAATLAAAYAEAGSFEKAASLTEQAIHLELKAGRNELVAGNKALLKLYRANKPYHIGEPTNKGDPESSTDENQ